MYNGYVFGWFRLLGNHKKINIRAFFSHSTKQIEIIWIIFENTIILI